MNTCECSNKHEIGSGVVICNKCGKPKHEWYNKMPDSMLTIINDQIDRRQMNIEHICKENTMHGTAGEDKVYYDNHEELWFLSTDCGCCHAEIKFCPFCGIKLEE